MREAGHGSFETWLDAFEALYLDPTQGERVPCPSCGERNLVLLFEADSAEDRRATAIFWCASCLYGLMPNASALPRNAAWVPRGKADVPNYRIIPPGT